MNVSALRMHSVGSLHVSSSWLRWSVAQPTAASCEMSWMRRELWLTGSAVVTPVCGSPVLLTCVSRCLTCSPDSHCSISLMSSGLSCRLLRLLSNSDFAPSGVQDRQVLERLWVLFLSALEHFLYDMRKACDLIGQFPLTEHSNRRSLVNTGQLTLVLM